MKIVESRTGSNIAANYFGKGWVALMGFIFLPWYLTIMGPEAYGIVGFLALLMSWTVLFNFGLSPTLNREMARFGAGARSLTETRGLLRAIEIVTYGFAAVIALSIWVMSGPMAENWFQNNSLSASDIQSALSLGAIVVALRFCESIYRGSLYGLERQVLANAISAITATIRGVGAILVLLFVSPTVQAFFIWQAIVSAITILALGLGTYRDMGRDMFIALPDWRALRGVMGFAGGIMATSVLALGVTQADKLVLSNAIPLEIFGYYVFAAKAATFVWAVGGPITAAIYPRFVSRASVEDTEAVSDLFHTWCRRVANITLPIAATLFVFGEEAIFVWSGNTELAAQAGPLLAIMALSAGLQMQCFLPHRLQLAYGWTSLGILINFLGMIFLFPTLILTAPIYGAHGAVWAMVAYAAGYLFIGAPFTFKRYLKGEMWRWYLQSLLPPALLSFAFPLLIAQILPLPSGRFLMLIVLGVSVVIPAGLAFIPRRYFSLRLRRAN